jgi:RNA polymerase sigma-70 factor (ECF subfamily)
MELGSVPIPLVTSPGGDFRNPARIGAVIDRGLEERIRRALEAGDRAAAATAAVRGYGPHIIGYLRAVLREPDDAADAFGTFCELLWRNLESYRGEAAFGTWAYQVAWSAVRRQLDDAYRRRRRRLETTEISKLAQDVYSSISWERSAATDRLAALRAALDPEEQTLLFLRIDQNLPWTDVARILEAREPALRKRFERLVARIRKLATEQGLVGER